MQRRRVVDLVGRPPSEALARPAVQLIVHHPDLLVRHRPEVAPLREVLAEQGVGVLVRPPLPRVVRQAEVALMWLIWQHLFAQIYERIRPASLNPAGAM